LVCVHQYWVFGFEERFLWETFLRLWGGRIWADDFEMSKSGDHNGFLFIGHHWVFDTCSCDSLRGEVGTEWFGFGEKFTETLVCISVINSYSIKNKKGNLENENVLL
jgi:hypothetical protein